MEIDLVYLWVDGNDPVWRAKKDAFTGNIPTNTSINCKGRYIDNDELKYSLRSAEKYAPWIRKIFIVTDNQTPNWLNIEHPKIKIIDHTEILPKVCLPCYNSDLIEYHLYKIPGLSEQFLYANDDMFFNKPVQPNDFFAADGLPYIRLVYKPFRRLQWFWREKIRKKQPNQYRNSIANASKLIKNKYGKYFNGKPHHNIDAYLKSDCQKVIENIFKKEIDEILSCHIRSFNTIQRILFMYVSLAEKRGHLRYVTVKKSYHAKYNNDSHFKKIEKHKPVLFCMNDSEHVNDDAREKLKTWLSNYFPEKSEFEK